MLKYSATLSSAKAYAEAGKLDAWIHLYLNEEGHNIPFSDGLKLFDRYYISPALFPVSLFTRCTGPEPEMKYRIDRDWWEYRVAEMEKSVQADDDLPPLIVHYVDGEFELNDGNHRHQACENLGIENVWAIVWITTHNAAGDGLIVSGIQNCEVHLGNCTVGSCKAGSEICLARYVTLVLDDQDVGASITTKNNSGTTITMQTNPPQNQKAIIKGSGKLNLVGGGTFRFDSNTTFSNTGLITVDDGTTALLNTAVPPCPFLLKNGGTLRFSNTTYLPTKHVTVDNGGILDIGSGSGEISFPYGVSFKDGSILRVTVGATAPKINRFDIRQDGDTSAFLPELKLTTLSAAALMRSRSTRRLSANSISLSTWTDGNLSSSSPRTPSHRPPSGAAAHLVPGVVRTGTTARRSPQGRKLVLRRPARPSHLTRDRRRSRDWRSTRRRSHSGNCAAACCSNTVRSRTPAFTAAGCSSGSLIMPERS